MEIGKIASITVTCDKTNVAGNLGSGDVDVFATPSMIANMEYAAAKCVLEDLEEGQTTVGTYLNVKHTAATPVGMKVTATATLREIQGRKMWFDIEVNDEKGKCGEGSHLRIMVTHQGMKDKAQEKAQG